MRFATPHLLPLPGRHTWSLVWRCVRPRGDTVASRAARRVRAHCRQQLEEEEMQLGFWLLRHLCDRSGCGGTLTPALPAPALRSSSAGAYHQCNLCKGRRSAEQWCAVVEAELNLP